MCTRLEVYECRISVNRHSRYSVGSPNNIAQGLAMQKELDVINRLADLVLLILPEVLILCAKAKHWDIHRMVVQWVGPQNERDQDEQPGVMKFVPRFLLLLFRIAYQFIQQELQPVEGDSCCTLLCNFYRLESELCKSDLVQQFAR